MRKNQKITIKVNHVLCIKDQVAVSVFDGVASAMIDLTVEELGQLEDKLKLARVDLISGRKTESVFGFKDGI